MLVQMMGERFGLLFVAWFAVGCGESNGKDDPSGGSGAGGSGGAGCAMAAAGQVGVVSDFPGGEPLCPRGELDLLRIRGSVAGLSLNIERVGEDASAAGVVQDSGGGFQTLLDPAMTSFFLGMSWTGPAATVPAEMTAGFLRIPAGEAGAGYWSFDQGQVLYAESDTDGDYRFAVTSVTNGAPGECMVGPMWATLTGCWSRRPF